MTTLPAPPAQAARAEWVSSWKFDAVPVADIPSAVHQPGKRAAVRSALAPHTSRVSVPSQKKLQPIQSVLKADPHAMPAPLSPYNVLPAAPLTQLASLTGGAFGLFNPPLFQSGTGSLAVSVGYAD
ncbi:MAG TPA: hypothetical protein VLA83_00565, partial [Candidatus Binatia bacterium]|nr:hypothetical protein [Candidatus Binatia bacterium]